jgi:hypothetical protein
MESNVEIGDDFTRSAPVWMSGLLFTMFYTMLFLRLLVWNSTKVIMAGGIFIEACFILGALSFLYLAATTTDQDAASGYGGGAIWFGIIAAILPCIVFCRRRTLRISLAII